MKNPGRLSEHLQMTIQFWLKIPHSDASAFNVDNFRLNVSSACRGQQRKQIDHYEVNLCIISLEMRRQPPVTHFKWFFIVLRCSDRECIVTVNMAQLTVRHRTQSEHCPFLSLFTPSSPPSLVKNLFRFTYYLHIQR